MKDEHLGPHLGLYLVPLWAVGSGLALDFILHVTYRLSSLSPERLAGDPLQDLPWRCGGIIVVCFLKCIGYCLVISDTSGHWHCHGQKPFDSLSVPSGHFLSTGPR